MWNDLPSMVNGMICGIGFTWFYHIRTMRSLKLREGHFPLGAILNIVRWGMIMVESTVRSTKWAADLHVVPSHDWLRTDFPEWIVIIPNLLGSLTPYDHQPTGFFSCSHCSGGAREQHRVVSHPQNSPAGVDHLGRGVLQKWRKFTRIWT